MRKIILLLGITLVGCSKPDAQIGTGNTPSEVVSDKIYNNMVYLDGTYERLNSEGNQLPVSPGDAVTIFERTTSLKITATTLETNLISPTVYFKSGSTYSLNAQVQFSHNETECSSGHLVIIK